MSASPEPIDPADVARIHAAYRKALWLIVGHAVFLVVCCGIALVARRMFKMPPALLSVAFVVALLLFGGDLWRFFRYRRLLQRLREENLA